MLGALEEQRRQIEELATAVERLRREKDRAWLANHAASQALLVERSRYEARIVAERLRGVELETEARVRAARILREAEEGAARLHSEAGAGFRDAAQKLRELLELRDALLEAGLDADLRRRGAGTVA